MLHGLSRLLRIGAFEYHCQQHQPTNHGNGRKSHGMLLVDIPRRP
jgi:hypothetical protein